MCVCVCVCECECIYVYARMYISIYLHGVKPIEKRLHFSIICQEQCFSTQSVSPKSKKCRFAAFPQRLRIKIALTYAQLSPFYSLNVTNESIMKRHLALPRFK